jgi:CMP-N-acetylneuraminic acid synthetase
MIYISAKTLLSEDSEMYKNRTILGIIPARGGSKGLPRKNILTLYGKPLIAWTIEQALLSKYLDKAIVSTDDKEIANIAKQYGAEVPYIRPSNLARDMTPTFDVILHAINFFKKKDVFFDYIALFEPTSPLRKIEDIDNAIKELIDNESRADSLVSVGEVHLEHPTIMKKIIKEYVKPYEKVVKKITRRQELDRVFFPYGVIYLSKTEELLKYRTFYQERTIPYFIERWQNYEVDDLFDFICIEAVLGHKMKGEY